jgi:hypothetical protein
MRTARDGARALREALDAEGGTVAGLLIDLDPEDSEDSEDPEDPEDPQDAKGAEALTSTLDQPGPAQVAATGPRTRGREREYEVLLEMILEGYRLHYGEPLVVRAGDEDLALLVGDQLYALGLTRLGELGDLDAVAELADVISLAAQAHAASNPDLARAAWDAGAVSVGWGPSDAHRLAKERARAHEADAHTALSASAAAGKTPCL